jgi:hypothetical protein
LASLRDSKQNAKGKQIGFHGRSLLENENRKFLLFAKTAAYDSLSRNSIGTGFEGCLSHFIKR